jgi:hypothetical protein
MRGCADRERGQRKTAGIGEVADRDFKRDGLAWKEFGNRRRRGDVIHAGGDGVGPRTVWRIGRCAAGGEVDENGTVIRKREETGRRGEDNFERIAGIQVNCNGQEISLVGIDSFGKNWGNEKKDKHWKSQNEPFDFRVIWELEKSVMWIK